MGKDEGTGGPVVSDANAAEAATEVPAGVTGGTVGASESSDPEQLRQEIEATREQMGDTVEALAAKADVKARAQEKVQETKETVAEKIQEAKERVTQASPETARTAAYDASTRAKQNPIPTAAAGAFLAGVLLGRITKRGRPSD